LLLDQPARVVRVDLEERVPGERHDRGIFEGGRVVELEGWHDPGNPGARRVAQQPVAGAPIQLEQRLFGDATANREGRVETREGDQTGLAQLPDGRRGPPEERVPV